MKKLFTLSTLSLCLLAACGGGSSGSSNNQNNDTTTQPTNSAPVANAGSNQSVSLGDQVAISGAQSSDADGDSLTYQWSLTNTRMAAKRLSMGKETQ